MRLARSGNLDARRGFNRLAEGGSVREAGVARDAFGQINRVADRQLLEALFDGLVGIEHAQLQIEDRLSGDGEVEVARLDDAGMDRADGNMKDALAVRGAIDVLLPFKGRQNRVDGEVFPQRMNLRPVVVQGDAARVGMALGRDSKPILNLALLPVDGGNLGGDRRKRRIFGWDGTPDEQIAAVSVDGRRDDRAGSRRPRRFCPRQRRRPDGSRFR